MIKSVLIKYLEKIGNQIKFGSLTIELPNGETLNFSGKKGLNADLKLNSYKTVLRTIFGGHLGFAESYLKEEWTSSDLESFLEIMVTNLPDSFTPRSRIYILYNKIIHFFRENTKSRAKKNIIYHYDLGNDFYRLWLDKTMTYSSGLFKDTKEDLSKAQENKYQQIIDQLKIKSHHKILEIGCGWGGFAEYAAKEHGLRVTGLTLSNEQLVFARERIEALGLSDLVEFKLQDYRDETGQYDGIASIEMFEAVGQKYWPSYFKVLRDCLKPGRHATLQIITVQDARWDVYQRGVDFIQKYIFPGGMLPSPSALRTEIETAGLNVVRSLEFGESYSQTLRRWHDVFNGKWDQVAALGFDERFRRMWNFYLTSCAATFSTSNCDVTQITVTNR